MPSVDRPLKVFLCHAHADRDAVRTLYTRLTKDGVDAWLTDKINIASKVTRAQNPFIRYAIR